MQERPPRRVQSSTQRDLQARVPREAPAVEIVDDETTGPIPQRLEDLEGWAERQRHARHVQARRLEQACDRIQEHGTRLSAVEQNQTNAKVAADGARLARQIRALLVALAVAIPAAAVGAGKAFLAARDEASRAAGIDYAERAGMRRDIDQLRGELAALVHLLRSDTP